MKRIIMLVSFGLLCGVADATQANKDSIPANPRDVSSVDAIIKAVYDVISGPAGQKRNWDRMRTLFVPDARMIATGKRPNGEFGRRSMSVEDYINNSGPLLEKDGFFESRSEERRVGK